MGVCINPSCTNTTGLVPATLVVSRYFGVKRHRVGLQYSICEKCMKLFDERNKQQQPETRVPLLETMLGENSSAQNEASNEEAAVVISDDEVMEVDVEESYYEFDESAFESAVTSSLERFDWNAKMGEAREYFEKSFDNIGNDHKSLNRTLDEIEQQLEQFSTDLDQLYSADNKDATAQQSHHTQKGVSSSNVPPSARDSSLDVIPVAHQPPPTHQLPPSGPIRRRELSVDARVYAMRASFFGIWCKARVVEIRAGFDGNKEYKVKFDPKRGVAQTKLLSGKHLAFLELADVMLPVGTRVIAEYKDEYWNQASSMYAGIIAEPPKIMNEFRYLIFFDDGYAQYVQHSQVHLVCEVSKAVWEDIHPDSKEFIKSYLQQYPERPMVKLQTGQVVKTEWNGKWWIANVVQVDGSLVKMHFSADKRTEWIYRGSTRLGPLYNELANAEANKAAGKLKRHNLTIAKKKNAPYVEYTREVSVDASVDTSESAAATNDEEPTPEVDDDKKEEEEAAAQSAKKHTAPRPNVAKKSTTPASAVPTPPTTTTPPARPAAPPRTGPKPEHEGEYQQKYHQSIKHRIPFRPHYCNARCLTDSDDPLKMKGKNPLLIPMLFGWERHQAKYRTSGKRIVMYRAPCGRRLREIDEIHTYLMLTQSHLSVDLFCFDPAVHCFGEFVPTRCFCYIKDISYGKENVPITCVNSLSRNYPEYVEYSTRRLPAKGVHLNLDPEFLVGCDCTDDCSDPSRCSCQRLTKSTVDDYRSAYPDQGEGYSHRRLEAPISTGIYECNERCKCRTRQCLNRVVQFGLQLRLQVFKTGECGWGIRCLDDIPAGGFVCIYAGQLLTEQGANEDGTQYGDEYLAELDYIEVVEMKKAGYEPDAVDPDDDSDKKGNSDSEKDASDEKEDDGDEDYARSPAADPSSSSDSDYEANVVGPVAPREKSSRRSTVQIVEAKGGIGGGCGGSKPPESNAEDDVAREDGAQGGTGDKIDKTAEASPKKEGGGSSLGTSSAGELTPTKPVRKSLVMRDDLSETDSDDEEDDSSPAAKDADDDSKQQLRKPSRISIVTDPKNVEPADQDKPTRTAYRSARSYMGEEDCYIMDAKSIGNIGRYLNHSCQPNVFVQNVFVDTHDIRFPWVAFFAMKYIRAGTELTWDYNYTIGSVEGKTIRCHCGVPECRGRLL